MLHVPSQYCKVTVTFSDASLRRIKYYGDSRLLFNSKREDMDLGALSFTESMKI